MFKVTTIEWWNGWRTATTYDFNNVIQLNQFVKLCKEDGIKVIVHNSQRSA